MTPDELTDMLYTPITEWIIWNAPDHEYTRRSVRAAVERALDEAFAVYEAMGGDASQGISERTFNVPSPAETESP